MKKENLIIIGAIVIVIIAVLATVFLVFNNETEYTTLQISKTCSLQVPVSNDADSSTDNYGIFYYVDKEHDLNITGFNSVECVTLSGAVQMASLRDSQQLNSQVVVENGTSIYYNKDTGIYTIFIGNDTTHDNILISTPNKDLLLTIVNSVNYGGDNQDNNSGNNNSATVDVSSTNSEDTINPNPTSDTNNDDLYYGPGGDGNYYYSKNGPVEGGGYNYNGVYYTDEGVADGPAIGVDW